MKRLRRGLAAFLCVLMPFSLTGMAPGNGTVYAETETHVYNETLISVTEEDKGVNVVALDAGNGEVSQNFVTLNTDGTLPELPVPTRTGWEFVGWYTDKVTENYWGDEEGETLEGLKDANPDWSLEKCKEKTFTWIINSEGKQVSKGSELDTKNVTTLYAMYEPTTVSVVWHSNGWRNEDKIYLTGTKVQYDSPITPLIITSGQYSWDGREFLGWYTAPEGGEQWEFFPVNDYEISKKVVTGNLDLYAYWTGGPEAKELRLSSAQHAEPGSTIQISASYTPYSSNKPKITWMSDSDLVKVVSVDDLTVTLSVSKEANVIIGNKKVTITAKTEQGVTATTEVTICHNWNNGKTIKYSSCTQGGAVRYTCKDCGVTKDVNFQADGHRFGTVGETPTCTSDGYSKRYCTVCGLVDQEIILPALGHNWSVATVADCRGIVTTRTCTTCNLTEVSSVASVDPSLHMWKAWEVTTEATDTEAGEETRVCAVCGESEKREIPPVDSSASVPEDSVVPQTPEGSTTSEEPIVPESPTEQKTSDASVDSGNKVVNQDVYLESAGCWVRYDENGQLVKGWNEKNGNFYYFDPVTGAMAKGEVELDGKPCYFDPITGIGANLTWIQIGGNEYWYENGVRQGLEGRGKEIYDPASNAWYWLDSIDQGKKADSKDVYQESYSAYADREDGTGKWVHYDENGHMIKGWHTTSAGTYFFEQITGAMAKGTVEIDGQIYTFDVITGIMQ